MHVYRFKCFENFEDYVLRGFSIFHEKILGQYFYFAAIKSTLSPICSAPTSGQSIGTEHRAAAAASAASSPPPFPAPCPPPPPLPEPAHQHPPQPPRSRCRSLRRPIRPSGTREGIGAGGRPGCSPATGRRRAAAAAPRSTRASCRSHVSASVHPPPRNDYDLLASLEPS